jgi:hypothetical protein
MRSATNPQPPGTSDASLVPSHSSSRRDYECIDIVVMLRLSSLPGGTQGSSQYATVFAHHGLHAEGASCEVPRKIHPTRFYFPAGAGVWAVLHLLAATLVA